MNFKGRDIISVKDFSKEEISYIVETAQKFEVDRGKLLEEKIMASLFFEPSTRTRLSFESAMLRLGGKVLGFVDGKVSSAAKGETVYDAAAVISGYCDVIVIRHHEVGSAAEAADGASVPVINGGDGPNQHPTQTFLDLYTIRKNVGRLDGLNVGFVGDLKYGRTVHSLAGALEQYDCKMYLVSPESLRMPDSHMPKNYVEETDLTKVLPELDVLYATRIQKERFPNPEEYEKVKNAFILDNSILKHAKKGMKIMHPLPRVNEIKKELDKYEGSIYFQQAHNGVTVRKALLSLVLGEIK